MATRYNSDEAVRQAIRGCSAHEFARSKKDNAIKIALVNDTIYPYSKGGAQKRVWEISKRLAQRGHQVHLFGMKYWDGEEVIINDGVYLHGVCRPQQLYVEGRRSIKEAIYFACKVLRPLLKEDFDIVDCSNFPYFPCFSGKLHSMRKRSTLIITWHEVWDNYWYEYLGRKGIFGKWVERLVVRLSTNMIAISDSTKKGLLSIGAKGNIRVVPNGVDLEEIDAVAPAGDESDVIFAGRLIKEKNIDVLIRSIALTRETIPDIRCLIIGDGPERPSLEELTQDLGLEENIHFLGFLARSEDVFSYVKSSKVFVLPSTREGFGIVVLEANACGLPVVTVRHPQNAASDLIIDGKNGFLCELNEEDIAQKITMALEARQDIFQGCVDYARDYDWNKIAEMVEAAYRSAFGSERRKQCA